MNFLPFMLLSLMSNGFVLASPTPMKEFDELRAILQCIPPPRLRLSSAERFLYRYLTFSTPDMVSSNYLVHLCRV